VTWQEGATVVVVCDAAMTRLEGDDGNAVVVVVFVSDGG
jgi:hypothetical protein